MTDNQTLMQIALFVGGFFVAQWNSRTEKQDRHGLSLSSLSAQLADLKTEVGRHVGVGEEVARLGEGLRNVCERVDDLIERFDRILGMAVRDARLHPK